MLGYVCKYVPAEIFEAMGAEPVRLQPSAADFNKADELMHPNMCSYVKNVLETAMEDNYDGIVLTSCCDSVRRLYDVLKEKLPHRFIYILDVPRKVNDFSAELFESSILRMIREYEIFSGKHFSEKALLEILRRRAAGNALLSSPAKEGCLNIGLVGTRCSGALISVLKDHGVNILFDMTCTGLKREFDISAFDTENAGHVRKTCYIRKTCDIRNTGDVKETGAVKNPANAMNGNSGYDAGAANEKSAVCRAGAEGEVCAEKKDDAIKNRFPEGELMKSYVWQLLNQVPCLRMANASGRERYIEGFSDRLDGIICHTVKFCDMYSFEYAGLKDAARLPVMQVETDTTAQSEGQIRTRVEAFLESLDRSGGSEAGEIIRKRAEERRRGGGRMYVLGVDSGSTSTNAVILDDKKNIVAFDVIRTGAKSGDSAGRILENVLKKAGLKKADLTAIVSTGYGRVSIPYADENVTEITCHGKGAHYFNPAVRTLLDIGGQDSKAIRLNENGEVVDFVMNDKCAAGTGRFLEMMASTLELGVDELGPVSLEWKENIEITSMCSVFAESEVISLIARNKEKPDIAHGIHNAIAGKAFSLMKRVGLREAYMMTGGVARNPGVVKALEEKAGSSFYICDEPEIVGAVGAALLALERCN